MVTRVMDAVYVCCEAEVVGFALVLVVGAAPAVVVEGTAASGVSVYPVIVPSI